jgi:hypothetical protein
MQARQWILAVALWSVCCAAQAELLANGSFEDGAFAPPSNDTMTLVPGATALQDWEVFSDSVSWIGAGNPFVGLTASNGVRFLDLTDYQYGAPFGGVRQTIATVPARAYVLSFDLGSSTFHGRPCAVEVSAGTTTERCECPLAGTNNDWNQHSVEFTATGAETAISIVGVDGSNYIGLDNVSVVPVEGGVEVGGNEWRQLTETLRFTWNEVAAVCPLDGTTSCSGSIVRASDGSSVDVTGWIWARNVDVQALFDAIVQPGTVNFATEFASYSKVDDPDIHLVLGGGPAWFDPTRSDAAGTYLYGLTATSGTETGYRPWVRDAIAGNTDQVILGTTLPRTGRQSYTGVWLFRPGSSGLELKSLALKSSEVAGCKSVTGTVTLTGPAPAGGVVVTLGDTLAAASTPVSVKLLEGASVKTFLVTTTQVQANESGNVSASFAGKTLHQDLKVRPIGMLSVTLTPTTVVGGHPVAGLAKLECKAAKWPVTVELGSSAPSTASADAASIVVSQGNQSEPFTVSTHPVLAKAYATIDATANGIAKSKKLTVATAASVSPTSLKFGNQVINTTSGALSTTLSNKGAVSFSVGITVTGTNARYYVPTSNCPASLPAGASCTISVRFTPTVTGTKSAKLAITTSATSLPLGVTLSGTGVLPL